MKNQTQKQLKEKRPLPRGVYKNVVNGTTYFSALIGKKTDNSPLRKGYRSKQDAITARKSYEREKAQHGEDIYLLDPHQRADAVTALKTLAPYPGESLTHAVNFYVQNALKLKAIGTLAKLVDKFLADNKSHWQKNTYYSNASAIQHFRQRWGVLEPIKFNSDNLELWDSELKAKHTPITHHNILNQTRIFWSWAVAKEFVNRDLFNGFRLPKIKPSPVKFYSTEQCELILQIFTKAGLRGYAVLGLITAIRPEEIEKLTKKNFMVEPNKITIRLDADITKTSWKRTIEIRKGDSMGDCVWAWLSPNGKLEIPDKFVSSPSWKRKIWKKRIVQPLKALGVEKWIQDGLRHTGLTMHYAFYESKEKTCDMAGHSQPRTFDSYYHGLIDKAQAQAFYALRPKPSQSDQSL